eukprot:TRINITY_DN16353_c0_g1_i3.p2 TRINITY_DN16353_c0_g1~~TRINITY_DN16353_c0_g1_i3.p2  ORF type:complete len:142 (-),score=10.57 TRINITY_DN16353_c0_g1_i3:934-1359(-)
MLRSLVGSEMCIRDRFNEWQCHHKKIAGIIRGVTLMNHHRDQPHHHCLDSLMRSIKASSPIRLCEKASLSSMYKASPSEVPTHKQSFCVQDKLIAPTSGPLVTWSFKEEAAWLCCRSNKYTNPAPDATANTAGLIGDHATA